MLAYVIAGLVIGGIYAIAACGLVLTYQSAGILNFAFGAMAYFIARFYYFLNTQHNWAILPAGVVSITVVAPLLGVFLYFALFQYLRLSTTLVKIVATLGLSVTLAPLATLLFGNASIITAPGLAPQPVAVYRVDGVPVTLDQIIVYGTVLAIVIGGVALLRYTDIGLRIRAMVDSPAMTSLSGSNPKAISVAVWAASVTLAGLVGVLAGPTVGLDPTSDTLLMAAAFAAVIAAQLRSLPIAVVVGLLMGIAGSVVTYLLPIGSSLTTAVLPSIPFIVVAAFLIYRLIRRGSVDESSGVGGALDQAIEVNGDVLVSSATKRSRSRSLGYGPSIVAVIIVAILPLILPDFWVTQVSLGMAYAVVMLSFTLVVGEGGMVWLCMSTFAGFGALTAAQLATTHGWPVLAAVVCGGLVAMSIGAIIGTLTIRLGTLYVALVTLTFGLLVDNLVFTNNLFFQEGAGVTLNTPHFVQSNKGFVYFALVIFCVLGLFIVNLRRSTTGMVLTGVRTSEVASRTLGVRNSEHEDHCRWTRCIGGRRWWIASCHAAADDCVARQLRDVAWCGLVGGTGHTGDPVQHCRFVGRADIHHIPSAVPDLSACAMGKCSAHSVRPRRHRSSQIPRWRTGNPSAPD